MASTWVEEVAEPDLSMELQGQLKYSLTELEACCTKEESQGRCSSSSPQVREAQLRSVRSVRLKYAQDALHEIVSMLRSFDPELSKEKLSSDMRSILYTDSVVGHLGQPLRSALQELVPLDRSQWLATDVEGHLAAQRMSFRAILAWVQSTLRATRYRVVSLGEDPAVHFAAAGSVSLGSAGGVIGLIGGAAIGAAAGSVPSLFTFGLSIPLGMVAGGSFGALAGTATGASLGVLGGTAAFAYRSELGAGATRLGESLRDTAARAQEAAAAASAATMTVVTDRHFQTLAVVATCSAALAGVSAGVAGLVTGTLAGAVCGVVPAVFTLGLSIPIGAVVGGSAGLCAGAAAGGTVGLLGGGAAGTAYVWRGELHIPSGATWAKVRERANSSAFYVKTRIVGGTGGTA